MHLLLFTQTLIVFVSIFFICFIYGHFFLNINKKFFIKSNLESVDFVKPVLGYSIITTVSYYLFFNFNLYLKEIIILFLLVSAIIFLTLEKRKTFINFCKVFLFSCKIAKDALIALDNKNCTKVFFAISCDFTPFFASQFWPFGPDIRFYAWSAF